MNRTQYDECSRRCFRKKESKAALKTRLARMDAAEERRNLEGGALQDTPVCNRGIRERAPGNRVVGSDITTQSLGETQSDGRSERSPAKGVKVSDIPAGLSGKHSMDGKRDRPPA